MVNGVVSCRARLHRHWTTGRVRGTVHHSWLRNQYSMDFAECMRALEEPVGDPGRVTRSISRWLADGCISTALSTNAGRPWSPISAIGETWRQPRHSFVKG